MCGEWCFGRRLLLAAAGGFGGRGVCVVFPCGEGLAQFVDEGLLPVVRLKNAQVRHPVAHDGQKLRGVVDAGGNQQAAVGVGLRGLFGQQGALLKMTGDGGGSV